MKDKIKGVSPKEGLEKYFSPHTFSSKDYRFPPQKPTRANSPIVTLRREFKICGQIGQSGQRDKLAYLSLVHQIELGIEKGDTQTEVVMAVIRAVSPGLPLRDMLVIKCRLTLSALLTILKCHYRVDSSTELYGKQPMRTPMNSKAEPSFSTSSSSR